jgi:hypothetical protein
MSGVAHTHVPVPGNENRTDPLTPKQVKVPERPTYEDKAGEMALHDEQQVLRTEVLMLKGVRQRRTLMTLLEVDDPRKMDRYIARVQARWELEGASHDLARSRGEAIARLNIIEQELWSKYSDQNNRVQLVTGRDADGKPTQQMVPDPQAAQLQVVVLRNLLDLTRQRMELLGLTPKAIERLANVDQGHLLEFNQTIANHERMSRVAQLVMDKVEGRLRARAAGETVQVIAPDQIDVAAGD